MTTIQGTSLTTDLPFDQAAFSDAVRGSTTEPATAPAVVPLIPASPFSPPDPASIPERARPCSAPLPVEPKPVPSPTPSPVPTPIPLPQYEEPRRGCGWHYF